MNQHSALYSFHDYYTYLFFEIRVKFKIIKIKKINKIKHIEKVYGLRYSNNMVSIFYKLRYRLSFLDLYPSHKG